MVRGGRLAVDGTHIEADAALRSLRAELAPVDPRGDGDGDGEDGDGEMVPRRRRVAAGVGVGRAAVGADAQADRVRRRPRCRERDPDAKLRHQPGHRTHLVHRGQVAVDPKARAIVAVLAERAIGIEADCLSDLVTRRAVHRSSRGAARARRDASASSSSSSFG